MANNPFAVEQKVYNLMPNDEYIDACILSYQTAELPPGPMAMTNDTVPSTRFLLGAYLKDESGQLKCDANGVPIIARKWTKWMRISNNERSALMRLFDTSKTGFQNLFDILQDCDTSEGKLWTTHLKIMLEQSGDYQNIIRIKPGNNKALVEQMFYSDQYIPYKVIKAYGKLTPLSLAGCKFKDGVKTFLPEDMVEPDDIKD
jgi:hypothetical protein